MSRAAKTAKYNSESQSGSVILAFGQKSIDRVLDEESSYCERVFGMTPEQISDAIKDLTVTTEVTKNEVKHIHDKIDSTHENIKEIKTFITSTLDRVNKDIVEVKTRNANRDGRNAVISAITSIIISAGIAIAVKMIK